MEDIDNFFDLGQGPVPIFRLKEDCLEYIVTVYQDRTEVGVCCMKDNTDIISDAIIQSNINIDGKEYPVKNISMGAFRGCLNLKTVNIPEGIEKIYAGAFADCIALEEVYIPDSLEYLGFGVFSGCTNLKKVSIPEDCEINGEQFYGCNVNELKIEKRPII